MQRFSSFRFKRQSFAVKLTNTKGKHKRTSYNQEGSPKTPASQATQPSSLDSDSNSDSDFDSDSDSHSDSDSQTEHLTEAARMQIALEDLRVEHILQNL